MKLPLRERNRDEMICFIQMPMKDMEVSTPIEINGVMYELTGKPARILDTETPLVELLTKESTPQDQHFRDEALEEFFSSVENMPTNEKSFATVLRSDWVSVAAIWNIEKH